MIVAIGMVEFSSIARGIYAADQMLKTSEVEVVTVASTCPGKYIAIVHGDVAAVENSVKVGETLAEDYYIDSIIIPNVDERIFPAITSVSMPEHMQALGIMESFSLATMITCADQILKTADIEPLELRLGNGLGGKSYFTYTGEVAAVQSGTDAGMVIAKEKGLLVNAEIIPSPSRALVESLY